MASVQGASQLQARLHAMGNATPKMMNHIGSLIVGQAKLNAKPHRKTSNLEHSIHVASYSATRAVVIAGVRYAPFLEFGTRPHVITPNAARVLAWGGARRLSGALRKGAKADHFAMIVHPPGSKPYPFLLPAAVTIVKKAGISVEPIIKAWNGAA